jgi:hypothetical protein
MSNRQKRRWLSYYRQRKPAHADSRLFKRYSSNVVKHEKGHLSVSTAHNRLRTAI